MTTILTATYGPSSAVPALVITAGARASVRFLEFFASAIRNPHTRRPYARAAGDFRVALIHLPVSRRSAQE